MNQVQNAKTSFHYIKSFDTLRAFAAILVLLLHGSYGYAKGGFLGVDLFFVLSGFLITSLLLKEIAETNKLSLRKFYIRRALRLLPPLYICILIANCLWSFTKLYPGANSSIATISSVLYFTNIVKRNVAGNLTHLWSLAVEEHFYFFFPILIFYKRRSIISILCLLCVIVIALRIIIYNITALGLEYHNFYIDSTHFTFCKLDGILLGSIMAIYFSKIKFDKVSSTTKGSFYILSVTGIFLILLFTLDEPNKLWHNGGFVLTNLLCLGTVFLSVKYEENFLFKNKVMIWLGKRSYGIYAYHFPIFLFLENFRYQHSTVNFIFVFFARIGVSIVIAGLSYRYIEQPILKFKSKFEVEKLIPLS